ncbi:hypothetical protein C2I36_14685 [Rhodobacteraceae bacterium WD3A24]|nr:hypothetical protein C2I36_14685 [Rhodobacteraceae bacterium WD3A24]
MRRVASALVCTNHLFMWAGSELVAIEMAEELLARGIRVDIFATLADRDFLHGVFGDRAGLIERAEAVDLARYDLVYAQHHVFPPILDAALARGPIGAGPVLVCNHLSPFVPLEAPGPFVEPALADVILANSAETLAMLAELGPPLDAARLWPNPAPRAFAGLPAPPAAQTYLAVSNHRTPELAAALDLLARQGTPVRRIGQGHASERVSPAHMAAAGGVATIGKTVQYALRAGRAVYCYGPHGGPGWLDEGNFEAARAANFSGRSHPERKSSEKIADELVAGLPAAARFADAFDPAAHDFCLEALVDGLLEEAGSRLSDPAWQARRRDLLASPQTRQAVALEANLCGAIRKFYLNFRKSRGDAARVA